jgi:hypothetical protein
VNAWTDLLVLRVDVAMFLTTAGSESSSSDDDKCFVWAGKYEQASPNSLLTRLRRQRQIDRVGLCDPGGCQQSARAISQQQRLGRVGRALLDCAGRWRGIAGMVV